MWKSLFPGTIGAIALGALLMTPTLQARAVGNCHVGSYRLADGKLVDISPDEIVASSVVRAAYLGDVEVEQAVRADHQIEEVV